LLYYLRLVQGVRQVRREYFYDLSIDRAVEVAQGLRQWQMEWAWLPAGQPTPLRSQRRLQASPATGIGAQAELSTTS